MLAFAKNDEVINVFRQKRRDGKAIAKLLVRYTNELLCLTYKDYAFASLQHSFAGYRNTRRVEVDF